MRDHLIFTLYGPLQSWGVVAVGVIRPTSPRPTRSAVLGLVAGALGIRRHEEERLAALYRAFGVAVRVDARGVRLADYHTVQTPKERARRVMHTRRDELGGMLCPDEEPATIVSRREYLADAVFTACLWAREDGPPVTLADIASALERPCFTPCLGRKACPPAAGFRPRVVSAEGVRRALAGYDHEQWLLRLLDDGPHDVFADRGHGEPEDAVIETLTVRDAVEHHGRRQFGLRREDVLRLDA